MGKRIWKREGTAAWKRAMFRSAWKMGVGLKRAGGERLEVLFQRYMWNKTPEQRRVLKDGALLLHVLDRINSQVREKTTRLAVILAEEKARAESSNKIMARHERAKSGKQCRTELKRQEIIVNSWIKSLQDALALTEKLKKTATREQAIKLDTAASGLRKKLSITKGNLGTIKRLLEN